MQTTRDNMNKTQMLFLYNQILGVPMYILKFFSTARLGQISPNYADATGIHKFASDCMHDQEY